MSGVKPDCSRSEARGARREAASDASPASEGAHGASDKHTERPSGASGRAAPHTCVRGGLKPQPHTHTHTHATRPRAYVVLVVEVGLPLDEQLGDGGLVVASCEAQRSVAILLVRRRIDGAHAERGRRGRARRLRARASDASGRTTPAATRWRRLARERAPTASRRRRAARRATRACVAAAGAAAEAPPTPRPRVHERGATTHTHAAPHGAGRAAYGVGGLDVGALVEQPPRLVHLAEHSRLAEGLPLVGHRARRLRHGRRRAAWCQRARRRAALAGQWWRDARRRGTRGRSGLLPQALARRAGTRGGASSDAVASGRRHDLRRAAAARRAAQLSRIAISGVVG